MLSKSCVLPDVIGCRTGQPLKQEIKRKIALFCNVKPEGVIEAQDANTIYEVPIIMMHERLDLIVLKKLDIKNYHEPDLSRWKEFLDKLKNPKVKITIGLIGKYVEMQD